jgi:hypothetical protein
MSRRLALLYYRQAVPTDEIAESLWPLKNDRSAAHDILPLKSIACDVLECQRQRALPDER